MKRTAVKSSNLVSVGYENKTLEIEFKGGGVYTYENVPEEVYKGLISATSIGSYFHKNIKNVYVFKKIK